MLNNTDITKKMIIIKDIVGDAVKITEEAWQLLAQELYDLRLVLKRYTAMEKELKEKLISLSNNESTFNARYFLQRCEAMGRLDYIRIMKDYNVDAERYRKESIISWKLTKL